MAPSWSWIHGFLWSQFLAVCVDGYILLMGSGSIVPKEGIDAPRYLSSLFSATFLIAHLISHSFLICSIDIMHFYILHVSPYLCAHFGQRLCCDYSFPMSAGFCLSSSGTTWHLLDRGSRLSVLSGSQALHHFVITMKGWPSPYWVVRGFVASLEGLLFLGFVFLSLFLLLVRLRAAADDFISSLPWSPSAVLPVVPILFLSPPNCRLP